MKVDIRTTGFHSVQQTVDVEKLLLFACWTIVSIFLFYFTSSPITRTSVQFLCRDGINFAFTLFSQKKNLLFVKERKCISTYGSHVCFWNKLHFRYKIPLIRYFEALFPSKKADFNIIII